MTQESFDAKMDATINALLETIHALEDLNDDDFSVSLAAFRFVAGIAMAEGWDHQDLVEHLEEEWKLTQEMAADYRKSLN